MTPGFIARGWQFPYQNQLQPVRITQIAPLDERVLPKPKGVSYEPFAAEGWHEAGKLGLDHGIK